MTPASPDEMNVKNTEKVKLPGEQHRCSLAIRRSDWDRVKRCLDGIQEPQRELAIWYSILFGVAGCAGLSIVPLAVTKDLPTWVLPVYICVTVASLVLAIILVRLEKAQKKRERFGVSFAQADMKAIEEMYEQNPAAGTEPR